ncbi:hypothetical protein [Tenacibaculum agarivorans]|uniref:hypothetical protein n=1 Tax=Tenacibaculum agarivorans TaxID=1908389 RepID=UPI00094B858A|nr:hypothetical protein [Tenacibaculum agarivorans]
MDTKEPTGDYIKGFNKGYILREHKPNLAKSLRLTKFPESEKDYQSGFYAGIDQKEKELTKIKTKALSLDQVRAQYKDQFKTLDKTSNKEMDRD